VGIVRSQREIGLAVAARLALSVRVAICVRGLWRLGHARRRWGGVRSMLLAAVRDLGIAELWQSEGCGGDEVLSRPRGQPALSAGDLGNVAYY
jgi:hypothetical protein